MATLRRERELSERTLVISIALVEPDKATLRAHAAERRRRAHGRDRARRLRRRDHLRGDRLDQRRPPARVPRGRGPAGGDHRRGVRGLRAAREGASRLRSRRSRGAGSRIRRSSASIRSRPGRTCRRAASAGGSAAALAWMRPSPGREPIRAADRGRSSALVDLNRGEVIRIDDYGVVPVPPGTGEYRTGTTGPEREGMQADRDRAAGGRELRGRGQPGRAGRTGRSASASRRARASSCTSSATTTAASARSILHRASFCEMAVPYGDPSPIRYIQCPFDIGENLIGTLANSLELGCDCLGEIHYFDAVVCNGSGRAGRASRTRSACTRRTPACSGSTGTSARARPRCGARAGS